MEKNSLVIGKEIGSGGEGIVFQIGEGKVYKEFSSYDEKRSEKLIELKNIKKDTLAAPIDLIKEGNKIVGYTMKEVTGQSLKVFLALTERGAKKNIKRDTLIDIALNITRTFQYLHERNILVGDVSDNNILIDSNQNIYFIDIDSFQIKNFLCTVGTDEFTPPELIGKGFKNKRTISNEEFSLGILLFKILLLGQHPFSVINGGSYVENIKNGAFAYPLGNEYSHNTPIAKKWLTTWNDFPVEIKEMFFKLFKENTRFSSKEWTETLLEYKNQIESKKISNEIFSDDEVANVNVATELNRRTGIGEAKNIINENGSKIGILEISTKAIKLLIRNSDINMKEFSYDDFSEKNGGFREGRLTNIGKFLDKNRYMDILALKRAIDKPIKEFLAKAKELNVKNLYCVSTAAIRGAQNRDGILKFLKKEYNLSCSVLSRDNENNLTTNAFKYTGEIHTNGRKVLENSIKKNYLFIDQGGGSTEIAVQKGIDSSSIFSKSLNFGSTILLNTLTINNNLNTPLDIAFKENFETVKNKISNTLRKEVKDIEIHECIAVGTAITGATRKKGNKKQHCCILDIPTLEKQCKESVSYLLENFKSVKDLLDGVKLEEYSGKKERPLDNILTKALGLPAYIEIMKKFKINSLIVSGTGLWYGAYYYYLEEELGLHKMDMAN